ncbi:MAG: Two-component system sensor histidine kinase, partial [uncultured Cytophagales bacterium]
DGPAGVGPGDNFPRGAAGTAGRRQPAQRVEDRTGGHQPGPPTAGAGPAVRRAAGATRRRPGYRPAAEPAGVRPEPYPALPARGRQELPGGRPGLPRAGRPATGPATGRPGPGPAGPVRHPRRPRRRLHGAGRLLFRFPGRPAHEGPPLRPERRPARKVGQPPQTGRRPQVPGRPATVAQQQRAGPRRPAPGPEAVPVRPLPAVAGSVRPARLRVEQNGGLRIGHRVRLAGHANRRGAGRQRQAGQTLQPAGHYLQGTRSARQSPLLLRQVAARGPDAAPPHHDHSPGYHHQRHHRGVWPGGRIAARRRSPGLFAGAGKSASRRPQRPGLPPGGRQLPAQLLRPGPPPVRQSAALLRHAGGDAPVEPGGRLPGVHPRGAHSFLRQQQAVREGAGPAGRQRAGLLPHPVHERVVHQPLVVVQAGLGPGQLPGRHPAFPALHRPQRLAARRKEKPEDRPTGGAVPDAAKRAQHPATHPAEQNAADPVAEGGHHAQLHRVRGGHAGAAARAQLQPVPPQAAEQRATTGPARGVAGPAGGAASPAARDPPQERRPVGTAGRKGFAAAPERQPAGGKRPTAQRERVAPAGDSPPGEKQPANHHEPAQLAGGVAGRRGGPVGHPGEPAPGADHGAHPPEALPVGRTGPHSHGRLHRGGGHVPARFVLPRPGHCLRTGRGTPGTGRDAGRAAGPDHQRGHHQCLQVRLSRRPAGYAAPVVAPTGRYHLRADHRRRRGGPAAALRPGAQPFAGHDAHARLQCATGRRTGHQQPRRAVHPPGVRGAVTRRPRRPGSLPGRATAGL